MRPTTRTFIAVDLNQAVRTAARDTIRRLDQEVTGVKWVEPENLHITVKFLGEIPSNELYEVAKGVQAAVDDLEPFEVELVGVGAFPSIQRPRTIWIGVGDGADEMVRLWENIETELHKLGHPREGRVFTPHLTLGRMRRGRRPSPEMPAMLQEYSDAVFGRMTVNEACVYSSELSRQGPKYEIVGRGRL